MDSCERTIFLILEDGAGKPLLGERVIAECFRNVVGGTSDYMFQVESPALAVFFIHPQSLEGTANSTVQPTRLT